MLKTTVLIGSQFPVLIITRSLQATTTFYKILKQKKIEVTPKTISCLIV